MNSFLCFFLAAINFDKTLFFEEFLFPNKMKVNYRAKLYGLIGASNVSKLILKFLFLF